MFRPSLVGWAWAVACAPPDPEANVLEWEYEAPPPGVEAELAPDEIGAALDRALPALARLDPDAFETRIDALAEDLGNCGVTSGSYSDQSIRYWFDAECGEIGSISGFAYELDGAYDSYGTTGTSRTTYWAAEVRTGEERLAGVADWGVYDVVYPDGTRAAGGYFEGELDTDGLSAPIADYDPANRPTMGWATITDPSGAVYVGLDGTMSNVDDAVDAVTFDGVYVDPGCSAVSGFASVHAAGGGWYDLELLEIDADCRACGPVTGGGDACVDVEPIVVQGGVR